MTSGRIRAIKNCFSSLGWRRQEMLDKAARELRGAGPGWRIWPILEFPIP